MEEMNILTEGIETLNTIKENLLELKGYDEKSKELSLEEQVLDEKITEREQQIDTEIGVIVRKRKEEVSSSFDEQLHKTESRIKKVKAKKEKLKDVKVSQRIKIETKELEEDRVSYVQEIKEIFKVNKIPQIFNTQIYYSLFMPRTIKDILCIILVLLFFLAVLPFLFYYFLLPNKTAWVIITYIINVVVFSVAYVAIVRNTKDKHKESFERINEIRKNLAMNKKRTNDIKKMILKDKDESSYGLEKFEEEIQELEQEMKDILAEQKEALVAFEGSTKESIAQGIWENYKDELDELKAKHEEIYNEQKNAESKSKEYAIEIAKRYEAYVGKEMLTLEHIDELIQILETGESKTINDAIRKYADRMQIEKVETNQ